MRIGPPIIMLALLMFFGQVVGLAQQDPFDCRLDGDFVVPISRGEIVRSDKGQDDAQIGPLELDPSIPAGIYEITLASYDDHDETDSTQPGESWLLLFSNAQTTRAISDLPDEDQFITEVVETALELRNDITQVWAIHRFYPDKSSPNSVVPLCAAFTLIQEETPAPTATVVPPTATDLPPTATPDPTATTDPTATDTPAILTPTWTPQVVPTYCNPDTGTCTNAGTG